MGSEVRLLTHLVVREDAHILYGFGTQEERALFRNLLKVSQIGPKIALAILSGVSVEGFATLVKLQDTASLTKIPGVGRKTAERVLMEMRDRLDADRRGVLAGALPSMARRGSPPRVRRGPRSSRSATSPPKSRRC